MQKLESCITSLYFIGLIFPKFVLITLKFAICSSISPPQPQETWNILGLCSFSSSFFYMDFNLYQKWYSNFFWIFRFLDYIFASPCADLKFQSSTKVLELLFIYQVWWWWFSLLLINFLSIFCRLKTWMHCLKHNFPHFLTLDVFLVNVANACGIWSIFLCSHHVFIVLHARMFIIFLKEEP